MREQYWQDVKTVDFSEDDFLAHNQETLDLIVERYGFRPSVPAEISHGGSVAKNIRRMASQGMVPLSLRDHVAWRIGVYHQYADASAECVRRKTVAWSQHVVTGSAVAIYRGEVKPIPDEDYMPRLVQHSSTDRGDFLISPADWAAIPAEPIPFDFRDWRVDFDAPEAQRLWGSFVPRILRNDFRDVMIALGVEPKMEVIYAANWADREKREVAMVRTIQLQHMCEGSGIDFWVLMDDDGLTDHVWCVGRFVKDL